MSIACIAHQDFFDLYIMATISRACVHGMAEVDATAHGKALDNFDTHDNEVDNQIVLSGVTRLRESSRWCLIWTG